MPTRTHRTIAYIVGGLGTLALGLTALIIWQPGVVFAIGVALYLIGEGASRRWKKIAFAVLVLGFTAAAVAALAGAITATRARRRNDTNGDRPR